MQRFFYIALVVFLFCSFSFAQRTVPASEKELAEVTARGKELFAYDQAAWHSTEAVREVDPELTNVRGYVASRSGDQWSVVYGRLNDARDKYLVAFEATQQSSPSEFKVTRFEKAKEVSGYFLNAAKAIELTKASFEPAESRPYNVAVLPAEKGNIFVYYMPAQTRLGVFPLGGDVRFLVSSDGEKLLETRQLHRSIIEFSVPEGAKVETGFHTAVLDDVPEDTDVFHVLARKPKVPEMVVTQKFVYVIAIDGSIKYLMTTEAFRKVGQPKQ